MPPSSPQPPSSCSAASVPPRCGEAGAEPRFPSRRPLALPPPPRSHICSWNCNLNRCRGWAGRERRAEEGASGSQSQAQGQAGAGISGHRQSEGAGGHRRHHRGHRQEPREQLGREGGGRPRGPPAAPAAEVSACGVRGGTCPKCGVRGTGRWGRGRGEGVTAGTSEVSPPVRGFGERVPRNWGGLGWAGSCPQPRAAGREHGWEWGGLFVPP